MKSNPFRAAKDWLQRFGILSVVMVWIGVLRNFAQDIPKDFP